MSEHADLNAEGPSFPPAVKLLAGAMMAALLHWAWLALDELRAAQAPLSTWLLLGAALLVVLACYIGMLRSRTSVSASHVRQRWLWHKEVALADVRQAKLIDLPGLRWLIAPRLMLRLRGGGFCTFHAADPAVLASFRRLGLGEFRSY